MNIPQKMTFHSPNSFLGKGAGENFLRPQGERDSPMKRAYAKFDVTYFSLFNRDLDTKPGSPGIIILHPYVAMMVCDDGIDNGQTKTGSR
jgi:hypothetical protein